MTKLTERQEAELASEVQVTKRALLELLPEADREASKGRGSDGPILFEDKAKARGLWLMEQGHMEEARALGAALAAFQKAVNEAWVAAVRQGLPSALAAEWRRKNRLRAQGLSKEDVEAEVMFALRHFIIRFDPHEGERLFSYAYRGVLQHLTEWSTQTQMPVHVPQKEARTALAVQGRFPVREDDEMYDPWPAVDAYLDGEISAEDL
jgi:hypothetical protein